MGLERNNCLVEAYFLYESIAALVSNLLEFACICTPKELWEFQHLTVILWAKCIVLCTVNSNVCSWRFWELSYIYIYISGICMVILSEYVFWQLNGVFCCSFQGGAFYFYFYFLLFIYFFECHPCSMMCCAFGLIG